MLGYLRVNLTLIMFSERELPTTNLTLSQIALNDAIRILVDFIEHLDNGGMEIVEYVSQVHSSTH